MKKKKETVKINLNEFSKSCLISMVEACRTREIYTEEFLAAMLRGDLINRGIAVTKKIETLGPVLKSEQKRISVRTPKKKMAAYNKKVDQYNGLIKKGKAYYLRIQAIETEYPELKKGDTCDD